jgi:hypothetical protein
MLPLKLEKLHSYGALKVLPNQLLIRTLYLKYVEELIRIIQRPKVLSYKDLMSKLYISLPFKKRLFAYIPWLSAQGLYTSRS